MPIQNPPSLYRPTPHYTPRRYTLSDHLSPPERLTQQAALYRQFTVDELSSMLSDLLRARSLVRPPPATIPNIRRDRNSLPKKSKVLRRIRIALGLGPRAGYVMVEEELNSRIKDIKTFSIAPRNPTDAVLYAINILKNSIEANPTDGSGIISMILADTPLVAQLRLYRDREAARSVELLKQAADWRPSNKSGVSPPVRPRPPAPPPPSTDRVELKSARPVPRKIDDLLDR